MWISYFALSICRNRHFTDDGVSGTTFEREGFQAMIAEVEAAEEWDLDGLQAYFARLCLPQGVRIVQDGENIDRLTRKDLTKRITDLVHQAYEQREQKIAESNVEMREIERVVLLRCVDDHWMDHIDEMDQLRQGIGLRAYGQRDPVVEYKFEGYDMFENMTHSIQEDTLMMLFHLNIQSAPRLL